MSTDDVVVRPISFRRAARVVASSHYALRVPSMTYPFGAMIDGNLSAVCTFGIPPNVSYFSERHPWDVLELNRLVVLTPRKNLATILISRSVKLLPRPMLLVSYADTSMGHIGYVYQASNWIYTGLGRASESYEIDGNRGIHTRSVYNKYGTQSIPQLEKMGLSVVRTELNTKHRYFYPLAKNHIQRKEMIKYIDNHFHIQPYPKGKSERYDIDEIRESKLTSTTKGFFV